MVFIFFKLICSTWINTKRDLHLAHDFMREKLQLQKFAVENLGFPWRLFYFEML